MLHRQCANRQADRLSYRFLCSKAPCYAWPDTTRGSAGEEAGTKLGDKCRYGVPASGPEVRANMTWGMGWMNYHNLLSMEVAASDLGLVRSPLLPSIYMKYCCPSVAHRHLRVLAGKQQWVAGHILWCGPQHIPPWKHISFEHNWRALI